MLLDIYGNRVDITPLAMPKLMLAGVKPPSRSRFYLTQKLDGHCLFLQHTLGGSILAYSRTGESYGKKLLAGYYPWLQDFIAKSKPGDALVGELYRQGLTSTDVVRELTAGKPLDYTCFGVLSIPYTATMSQAKQVAYSCGQDFVQWQVLEAYYPEDFPSYVEQGSEGLVLRWGQFYQLRKWKPKKSITLVASGVIEGINRLQGTAGAIQCSAFVNGRLTHICNVGTGLTDADRLAFWNRRLHATEYVAVPIEVEYDCITPEGSLRFPRFVRLRTDVLCSDCSLEQEPELLAFHTVGA